MVGQVTDGTDIMDPTTELGPPKPWRPREFHCECLVASIANYPFLHVTTHSLIFEACVTHFRSISGLIRIPHSFHTQFFHIVL